MSDKPVYAGTNLRVPATFQSDEGPRLELRGLETDFAAGGGEHPVNLTLKLRCNAEAVRRLAMFFDLYGQGDEWNKRAAPGMFLPPSTARTLPLPFDNDGEEDCDE